MVLTVGRIVVYTLSADDAAQINRRRTNSGSIAERIQRREWPIGAQAHVGANVGEGDVLPMLVTRVAHVTETTPEGDKTLVLASGQVFTDGSDQFWAPGRRMAEAAGVAGTWAWPARVG